MLWGWPQKRPRVRTRLKLSSAIALIIAGTCHEIALEGHLTGLGHHHNGGGSAVHSLATTLSTLLEQP